MSAGKTYVIGDIHGSASALKQCLERAAFDRENDILISLGDLCDGWPETAGVFEILISLQHLIFVRGNHDQMMLDWVEHGKFHPVWLDNGGQSTIDSYPDGVPDAHRQLLRNSLSYYLDGNRLFVHAGIDTSRPLQEQGDDIFLWDRALFKKSIQAYFDNDTKPLTSFTEVYIGHCPIHRYELYQPVQAGGVWMMDTGAGWDGRLSMMSLDDYSVYQSDPVTDFYPPGSGRAG